MQEQLPGQLVDNLELQFQRTKRRREVLQQLALSLVLTASARDARIAVERIQKPDTLPHD